MERQRFTFRFVCVPLLAAAFFCQSCSINNMVADALTGEGGSSAFTGDSDPQLVGDALPFAMKMYETLLESTPQHRGLMYMTGSLFVMYANAYVHGPAEMLPQEEWQLRVDEMNRAKQMYLKGSGILYRALETEFKGFAEAAGNPDSLRNVLQKCKKEDAGLLYWAVAGGLAAYSIDVLDFELNVRIPEWTVMMERAYELDPDFNGAALDEFYILFYSSLPETLGGNKEQAKFHFQKALERTGGNSAGAYVSFAQSICVAEQDYETFKDCLEKALAIDPNVNESTRLVTIISQRKARWLLDNAYTFFSFLPMPDNY